jgi:catechol 2,3-dioxygenase-like lactoylglutathione lyase family enzyme
MTTTQQDTATITAAAPASGVSALTARFEVTTLPVSDVDRAKAFYQRLGWRLDIDFNPTPDTRAVQFTPPGSHASIQFGAGTGYTAGPLQGLFLVVDDIEAARADLIGRGVDVGEIWHIEPGKGRVAGLDPQRRSYFSRASFADPDGNAWILQENHRATPGPRREARLRRAGSAALRDRPAPRRVRGRRPAARLVGLVRRLHGRARAGRHPRAGRQGRRALHGRRQARRRRVRLIAQPPSRWMKAPPSGGAFALAPGGSP